MIHFFSDEVEFPSKIDDTFCQVLEGIFKEHKRTLEYLNVIFVNDEKLLEMNRDFLQHDYYTDIITFNYASDTAAKIEGEIYISLDRVRENAHHLSQVFETELKRVIIHGILHLCGYLDKEERDRVEMQCAENKYLTSIVSRETSQQ